MFSSSDYFRIKQLSLKNFRIHSDFSCSNISSRVLISGSNGSGKTSILEALSMFSVDFSSFYQNSNVGSTFLKNGCDSMKVDIQMEKLNQLSLIFSKQKKYLINDKKIERQLDLSKYIKIYGIKPSDQYFFLEKKSKRAFFEMILSNINNEYIDLSKRYKNLMKQRFISISNNLSSPLLDSLEKNLVKIGLEMAILRLNLVLNSFNENIEFVHQEDCQSFLDKDFSKNINDDTIDQFCKIIKDNRKIDSITGRMKFSFHRFVFDVRYKSKNFNEISNSEQKECMYEFFLSAVAIFQEKLSIQPILLIDEVDAFFDKFKVENFSKRILNFPGQIFLTSPSTQISDFLSDLTIIRL